MSRNSFDELDKTMVAFATIMALFIAFGGGAQLEKHNWYGVGLAIITALFFVGILFAVLAQRFRVLNDKLTAAQRDIESMRVNKVVPAPANQEMPAELKKLLSDVVLPAIEEVQEHEHDHEMLQAILHDMGFEKQRPDDSEFARIEAAFHENTDRYLRLTTNPENNKIGVEFSDKPFAPGRSDAHEAARLRGDASRATDATKPLTKSQQRRKNAQAGHGPVTDEELREEKNRKRREARAAKKAASEQKTDEAKPTGGGQDNNPNAPLPGQTTLVE